MVDAWKQNYSKHLECAAKIKDILETNGYKIISKTTIKPPRNSDKAANKLINMLELLKGNGIDCKYIGGSTIDLTETVSDIIYYEDKLFHTDLFLLWQI